MGILSLLSNNQLKRNLNDITKCIDLGKGISACRSNLQQLHAFEKLCCPENIAGHKHISTVYHAEEKATDHLNSPCSIQKADATKVFLVGNGNW